MPLCISLEMSTNIYADMFSDYSLRWISFEQMIFSKSNVCWLSFEKLVLLAAFGSFGLQAHFKFPLHPHPRLVVTST